MLRRNVAALAARGVIVAEVTAEGPEVRLEPGPNDAVLSLRTTDGRWVRLHSQRDPVREADRLIAPAFESAEPALVIVIGLGLGYALEAIERRSSRTKVLALEPVPASLPHLLSRRDWTGWLTENRLRVLVGPEYSGASDAWKEFDSGTSMPPIVVHPVLAREAGAGVVRAREMVERIAFGAQANLNARKRFAGRYLLNTLKNLPVIAREGNAGALFGAFTGVPAIIASAGPSLDRNIVELRAFRDRAMVIAVDTALRPLLGAGIDPHLVVSVDPSEVNGRHLAGLPDPGRTWLVAEGSLDSIVFEQFQGRTFIFKVSEHHPWPWFRGMGIERDTLRAWGSVVTSAFDLALKMGSDPIIFAGQDLAYTGGRPYCRGTTFEERWATQVAEGNELPDMWARMVEDGGTLTEDISGHSVATKPQLVAFRDWIAEQAALVDGRTVINATGGGILHGRAIRQAGLGSVLALLPSLRELDARVRESWGRRAGAPAATPRTGPQLLSAFTHARREKLTTWASFASMTSSAMAVELDGVAVAVEAGLQPRTRRPEDRPLRSRDTMVQGPLAQAAQDRHAIASTIASARVETDRQAVVYPPELVRAFRAALFDEQPPEWARAAAAAFDPLDTAMFQKALDGLPPTALLAGAAHCEAAGAYAHAAALFARLADRLTQRQEPGPARSATISWFSCLFLAGRFESARVLGEAQLPDAFPVLCLSMIYQLVCDREQAVEKIEGLVAEFPDVPELRLNLAVRLAMSGNLQDALGLVDEDAKRWPGRAHPEYARGVCLRVHGDHDLAVNALAAITDAWPYAAPELVVASLAAGQPEAIERALRTLRASFRNPVAFVIVPDDQAGVVENAMARMSAELATERHRLDVSRLSPIAVRLFTQAENAWKPRWQTS